MLYRVKCTTEGFVCVLSSNADEYCYTAYRFQMYWTIKFHKFQIFSVTSFSLSSSVYSTATVSTVAQNGQIKH